MLVTPRGPCARIANLRWGQNVYPVSKAGGNWGNFPRATLSFKLSNSEAWFWIGQWLESHSEWVVAGRQANGDCLWMPDLKKKDKSQSAQLKTRLILSIALFVLFQAQHTVCRLMTFFCNFQAQTLLCLMAVEMPLGTEKGVWRNLQI